MKCVSIIGGDNRNLILSNLLKEDGYSVFRFGLEAEEKNIEECIKESNFIITATPFSVDSKNIYAPLVEKKINIQEFIDLVHNKTIIAGSIADEYIHKFNCNGNIVFDIMKDNKLVIQNTIPTAEGVVKIIIENTDITINDSNIAILGFGRVGKRLAKVLNGMGANIFCLDTKKEEVANIDVCGYNILKDIYKELSNMDVIVNTVPKQIIGKNEINSINKSSLIIDVSSKPGGIDFEYANKNGYNVIHALGLPGKVAPVTSAKYIKEIIDNLIV